MIAPTAEPIVAVCCQGSGVLALHALDDGAELGRIPVGEHPVHATTVNGRVYVATMDERSVSVIEDGAVSRIDVGVLGPSHFATAGGRLFVTCTAGDVVAAIDPRDAACLDRIGVGAEPHEIAAHDGWLYVGSRRDGLVSVIDPEQLVRVHDIECGSSACIEGIAVGPHGERGYAVDRTGRVLTFGLGDDGASLEATDVGPGAYELTVTDDRVYVPVPDDGVVHELSLDLADRRLHTGFDRPVDIRGWTGDHWVVDRQAALLRSLTDQCLPIPAGAIAARETEDGLVVSHYDNASLSLVEQDGVHWHVGTGKYPFGALVI